MTMTLFRFPAPILAMVALSACAPSYVQTGAASGGIAASAPGIATCQSTTGPQQQAGVAATNAVRRQAGLGPVTPDAALARAAAAHACDMAERGRMTHGGSRSSGPAQRVKALGYVPSVTAENIAAGPFDLNRVLAEWNASPGHAANILIPQMSNFGIGQALAADGRTRYWAAVYAAPQSR